MTTNPSTWLQNINAWVTVSQADQFPHINIQAIANQGQLVGKCDIHVAEAVLCQFAHFGSASIGWYQGTFHKNSVQLNCHLGSFLSHATNNTVIANQLMHYATGQNTLWAVGHLNISLLACLLRKAQIRTSFSQPLRQLLGRTNRRRRLQNNQIAFGQHWRNGFSGVGDIAQVRLVAFQKGGRDGDQKRVSRFRGQRSAQVATVHGGLHQHIQFRFNNMNPALIDRVDRVSVHINANDLLAA
ncbi:hypothetical protein ACI0FT_02673 [Alcaligenes nematophilus]